MQANHTHLRVQLAPDDLMQLNAEGIRQIVRPVEWREFGVKVGQHIPSNPKTVPRFMDAWCQAYE